MKSRLSIALGLAILLAVVMTVMGTVPVTTSASGPYLTATANYAVATAAAATCQNRECRHPGTPDLSCKHLVGSVCSVTIDNLCANRLCIDK